MNKIVEMVAGVTRTYKFVFDPDPEGGFVVTCPTLPGLVSHGTTLDEAHTMARDAMEGYLDVLLEDGEPVPESDSLRVGGYVATSDEAIGIDQGLKAARAGRFASETQFKEVFSKHRP